MCLIFVAWKKHPQYQLLLAANRDEYYDRPSASAAFWEDTPNLLAGRDLAHGGTWLGITRQGRLCMLTNYRDPASHRPHAPSRGALVAGFLQSDVAPADYELELHAKSESYNGFNIIFGTLSELRYYSNYGARAATTLSSGLYGLSNAHLDTPWPKVAGGTKELSRLMEAEVTVNGLFDILANREPAPDPLLPDTGVGKEWEKVLSSRFIVSEGYGTRSSTVILVSNEGDVHFEERSFQKGNLAGVKKYRFTLE